MMTIIIIRRVHYQGIMAYLASLESVCALVPKLCILSGWNKTSIVFDTIPASLLMSDVLLCQIPSTPLSTMSLQQ